MILRGLGNVPNKIQLSPSNGLALAFPLTVRSINPSPNDLTANGFTIEFWIYVNGYINPVGEFSYSGSEVNQMLVLASGPNGYSFYYRINVVNQKGYLTFYSYADGVVYSSTKAIEIEVWTHTRVTLDYTNNEIRFHVNNFLAGSYIVQQPLIAAVSFDLGHVGPNRSANNFFGLMDEFRWWKYPRTSFENNSSWRLRSKDLLDINPQTMGCCYSFEDVNQPFTVAEYQDGSGNGLFLRDSTNSAGGVQRGSSAPFVASGNNSILLATV